MNIDQEFAAKGPDLSQIAERLEEDRPFRINARRRATLILILAFWAFAILMLSLRAFLIDSLPISVMGPRRLVTALIGALLCLAMAQLLATLRNRSFRDRAAIGLIGAFAMAVVLTTVTMTMNRIILPLPGFAPFNLAESSQWALVWLGYFLAWTGTHLAMTYHWDSEDHRRRAALLAETTRQARMAALRYQLDPHFLFNTLNSISSLVGEERNADAEAMILNLATFVRSTLTSGPAGTIPLGEEIELQRLYLAIEQARFGDRLRVDIDLPDRLSAARVPQLILQPLVENAVRHGVSRCEDQLTIRIAAAEKDGRIELVVEDDGGNRVEPARRGKAGNGAGNGKTNGGRNQAAAGNGVGLANVRSRMEAHFGERGAFESGPVESGYRARLVFPRRIA
jgi:two-component system LytT family sensor kinase